jgi:DnaD/phage-associated family protein
MSFCKFSSQNIIENSTSIDNAFFNEHLPYAPAECVKVFLYGLYKCTDSASSDNTVESFSKVLNLDKQDVESAFYYWQQEGLVQILDTDPIEVRYLPIKKGLGKLKKFNEKKYASFNLQVQEVITGRMLTPTEYKEYYELIESLHITPVFLLEIVKYAVDLKGSDIGYKYISTLTKNWVVKFGIRDLEALANQLEVYKKDDELVGDVAKILGIRRKVSVEERDLYLKWTAEFGFLHLTITKIAKTLNKKGGFNKLGGKLTKYYELKLLDYAEIESYQNELNNMYDLAKQITKNMGLYYENLGIVVENYIAKWLSKGFSNETLLNVSAYCFKRSIRTLEGMNSTVDKFYKLGLVSAEAISQYINKVSATDKEIKQILDKLGLLRNVTSVDRSSYRTWTYSWGFNLELILYAGELSAGKNINYLNKILANWHENKITTLEAAKKFKAPVKVTNTKTTQNFKGRSYSSDELSALFDNLDEVDI